MFCAGRVPEEDLRRTLKACGGAVLTTVHDLNDKALGSCAVFEEKEVGSERSGISILCYFSNEFRNQLFTRLVPFSGSISSEVALTPKHALSFYVAELNNFWRRRRDRFMMPS